MMHRVLKIMLLVAVIIFCVGPGLGQAQTQTSDNPSTTISSTDNTDNTTLFPIIRTSTGPTRPQMSNIRCHVCSYYPNVKWPVDEECQETLRDDRFLQNCTEMKMEMETVRKGRAYQYRCRTTIGMGIGDKPFYIRGCSVSRKNYAEEMVDFDSAETSYCINSKCNK